MLHVRRGGDGPALLLLLHGLGADADVWDPLLPHVEERWRCAAVDLPGHGGSTPLARALKVAGLTDLVADDASGRLVVEADDGWRLTLDPAAFAVGEPDAAGLLAAARCPVVLARGADDPMVSHAQLAALVPDAVDLPGAGHNAHVEDPAAVAALLTRSS